MTDATEPDYEPSGLNEEMVPLPDEPVATEQFGYLLPGGRVVPLPPGIEAFDAAIGLANYNRLHRRTGTDRALLARRTVEPWAAYEIPKRKRKLAPADVEIVDAPE